VNLEEQMNRVLEKIHIPFKAVWLPSETPNEHSKIVLEEHLVMVYDKEEAEAWRSLFHEILEYRLRSLLSPYRKIINSLIEGIEEITYSEKERILDQVMKDFTVWRSLEAESQDSTNHEGKRSESTQNCME